MKVKIFRCEDMELCLENLENEVNDFIKNKKIIDIKFQEHTSYNGYNSNFENVCGDVFGSILVLYEDNKNEE